jgi:threonine synthase
MRFVTTRGRAPAVSLTQALFDGLAPDGGLYVPERIDPWQREDIARLPSLSLADIGTRVLQRFAAGEIDPAAVADVVRAALDFPMPLVEIEPEIFALELFHGPTLAFKDVGARVMARLIAVLGTDVTVLTATSGDTGSAVAYAFHGIANARVVILYPDGRVSPTQEAQLTMFNGDDRSNVQSYAIAGSFDDCQRLVKTAFADSELRQRVRLTSANSINVGRLLPQMIYYFHGVARLAAQRPAAMFAAGCAPVVCTPSGNFGNLTAGLMAKRAGLPIARFVASTNANDVVPTYLATGVFEPRPSIPTIANAMDVGNPSNFERLLWLYGGDVEAVRRDIVGSRHADEEVRTTIRTLDELCGYLLDPHSAIGYLGIKGRVGREGEVGIFLATAHPAKFSELVEPIVGRAIDKPQPLADALRRPKQIFRVEATPAAIRKIVGG